MYSMFVLSAIMPGLIQLFYQNLFVFFFASVILLMGWAAADAPNTTLCTYRKKRSAAGQKNLPGAV